MTQNNWKPGLYWPNRPMHVQFRFDRESFDALKELLREKSQHPTHNPRRPAIEGKSTVASEEPAAHRRDREALKRVFDQIRNVEYNDK